MDHAQRFIVGLCTVTVGILCYEYFEPIIYFGTAVACIAVVAYMVGMLVELCVIGTFKKLRS